MTDPRDWQAAGEPPDRLTSDRLTSLPADAALPRHLDPRASGSRALGSRPARRDPALLEPDLPSRPRRRLSRVLSWIAVSTAVLILAVSGLGYVAFNHYDGNIQRIKGALGLPGVVRPAAAPRNAQNLLIVGSDTRGDEAAGTGFQGSGATFVTGQRSDTVILAHLYGNSDKVQMVSFPRDSFVTIPSYADPRTGAVTREHQAKLNSAFAIGGPPLLVATIERLTGVRVDHYLQIDFTGFQSMVNKLGGVDVCLATAARDKYSGIDLPAGKHHIDGTVALAFVRQRHGLPGGDIDRIRRQQEFLGSMVRKVLSADTLLNPLKLNAFLNVATASLKTDDALTGADLRNLALRLRNFSAGGVIFSTVPVSDIGAYRNRESVVLIDDAKAASFFGDLRRDVAPGTPAPEPSGPLVAAQPLIVAPSSVRVTVYNGAGVAGLGRRAAADLATVGFSVVGTPTNRGTGLSGTTVYYGPDKADSARTLAATLPGATLQADASLGNIVEVVIGSGYTPAVAVTLTAPTSPQPTATTPAKVVTAQDDPCAA